MPVFETYLNASNLTGCFQADEMMASVNERLSAHKLLFPLWVDETASLRSNLCSGMPAPRCLRYGSFGQNVLGMNWRLPGGEEIGVGGRVIKNVTGLNLRDFLLTTNGMFGSPSAFVLRLRPASYPEHWRRADFDTVKIEKFRRLLARSAFYHAFEAFTVLVKPTEHICHLAFRAPHDHIPVFDRFLNSQACWFPTNIPQNLGGSASVLLKTLPSRSVEMASKLCRIMDVPVMCYPLHGFLFACEEREDLGRSAWDEIEKLGVQCIAEGGSYETRSTARKVLPTEQDWNHRLLRSWEKKEGMAS